MPFAEGTKVDVAKTRAEIETLARKHGASQFGSGWSAGGEAGITFVIKDRRVQFRLAMPTTSDKKVADRARRLTRGAWVDRLKACVEAEERRLWRCLLLAIKAKLEVVETGIETFEQAFLANIVTTDNMTIYERIKLDESDVKMLAPMEPGT